MNKAIKYLFSALMVVGMSSIFTSCSEDSLGPTIFPDIDSSPDPSAASYQLDKFCWDNYLTPYNLQFKYKLEDVNIDMDYNLTPASYEQAVDLAVLVKYLWFDAYKEVAGEEFLKQYGPRIIHVIGSLGHQPQTNTVIWGLTEGATKVSLYGINQLDPNDAASLTSHYFETMHHEFTHVLHQTKTYPSEFNYVSVGNYDGNNWQDRQVSMCNSKGFVTNYASSAFVEDIAETVSNYITMTDDQWNRMLSLAARGWTTGSASDDKPQANAVYYSYFCYNNNDQSEGSAKVYLHEYQVTNFVTPDGDTIKARVGMFSPDFYKGKEPYTLQADSVTYHDAKGRVVDAEGYLLKDNGAKYQIPIIVYDVPDEDGINGPEIILKKLGILRTWLAEVWHVDLDKLRAEVQKRQVNVNIEELRKQVYSIPVPGK